MFVCEKCGCCCRNLSKSVLYAELDRGDGICKYLNGNLCSIYETRPLLCRVDECYEIYFNKYFSRQQFYQLNKRICEKLKKTER